MSGLSDRLDSYFQITARGSTIATEIRAGVVSFLTLAYLLLINPQVLYEAGVPTSNGVISTALSSSVASFLVGVLANVPFGMAPGLGLSAFMAYGLVSPGELSLDEALSACFAVGIALLVLALLQVVPIFMRITPDSIKFGIVVGMGIFISFIGMVSVDLVVANEETLVSLGDVENDRKLQIVLAGTILVGSLVYHNVPGGILLTIAVCTFLVWSVNGDDDDDDDSEIRQSHVFEVPHLDRHLTDVSKCLFDTSCLRKISFSFISFLLICIFDISGVVFGLSRLANLSSSSDAFNEESNTSLSLPAKNSLWVLIAASLGSMIASLFGSTPIIVTVESATGIKEGGRTGLTAVIISLLFFLSTMFSAVLGSVPAEATAPALILIGALMMGECKEIEWQRMDAALPAFFTIVMMPLTYSITNGILFGLVSSVTFYITTGRFIVDWKDSQAAGWLKCFFDDAKAAMSWKFLDSDSGRHMERINSLTNENKEPLSPRLFPSMTRLNSFDGRDSNYGSLKQNMGDA